MPSGKFHARATLIAGSIVCGAMALTGFPTSEIAYTGLGFGVTLWVNPDLDLNTKISGDPRKALWTALWYPYSRMLPHRSFWSHFPIISTLLRFFYLWAVVAVFGVVFEYNSIPAQQLFEPLMWLTYGAMVSDCVHTGFDLIDTARKRKRSKRGSRK